MNTPTPKSVEYVPGQPSVKLRQQQQRCKYKSRNQLDHRTTRMRRHRWCASLGQTKPKHLFCYWFWSPTPIVVALKLTCPYHLFRSSVELYHRQRFVVPMPKPHLISLWRHATTIEIKTITHTRRQRPKHDWKGIQCVLKVADSSQTWGRPPEKSSFGHKISLRFNWWLFLARHPWFDLFSLIITLLSFPAYFFVYLFLFIVRIVDLLNTMTTTK